MQSKIADFEIAEEAKEIVEPLTNGKDGR